MTIKEFVEILKKPNSITKKQAQELDEIVLEYPYFQAARVLQLKILHSQEDYRYAKALKVASVHITDRTVLYDFIHSDIKIPNFNDLKSEFEQLKQRIALKDIDENAQPNISYFKHLPRQIEVKTVFEEPIFREDLVNHQELADMFVPKDDKKKNSVSDWLETISENEEKQPSKFKNETTAKKFELIDKFLETNPKIEPSKDHFSTVNLAEQRNNSQELMTETLAQVYVNQKKYKQAIQAYEILILKNPEKSIYFASKINQIKNLQQNNL